MRTHDEQVAAALRTLHERDWERRAACQYHDPELWFREDSTSQFQARTVCVRRCEVRGECLAHQLLFELGQSRRVRAGVFGGMTDLERWHSDPTVTDRTPLDGPRPDGTTRCGSYSKLLHHLLHGEHIDSDCWAAERARHQARLRAERRADQTDTKEAIA